MFGRFLDMCSFRTGKPTLDVRMTHDQPDSKSASTWTWFPSWHELTTHYFKEVGFLACLAQMIGATVFVSSSLFFYSIQFSILFQSTPLTETREVSYFTPLLV